ncbi:hypothetical protein [Arthrobacter sedimenti]|uniref:hypothetical protein n=1 Tax=Arthrobacter sedimenti TaxID=2694931 RepID=UPI0011230415|nr:hypothetical protein [Arthrobacter sedimenti]
MNITDVAQIVGSLATAVALFFIALQTRSSNEAVAEARKMHSLERERDLQAVEFEKRQQATQISCWPARRQSGDRWVWGVEVVNASPAPVFKFAAHRKAGTSRNNSVAIPLMQAKADVLPPGRYFIADDSRWPEPMARSTETQPINGNADYMATLKFRDNKGNVWNREPNGRLLEAVETSLESSTSS